MAAKVIRYIAYFIFFLTVIFLWPREMDGFTPGREGSLQVPENAMVNVHYVSVEKGKVEMETWAKEAIYDLPTNRMEAKKVKTFFFNEKQEKTEMTGDNAYFHFANKEVIMQQNVWSKAPDGFVLTGEVAVYSMPKREIWSAKPVEGVAPDDSLKVWGDSARSSLNDGTVNLVGDARAHLKDKRRGLTKVRGDSALVMRDKAQVTFHDHVKVEQQTTIATSDIAHLFYDNKDRTLRYMSMLDNVKIEEKDGRHTRSQVAEFFAPTDTIVLSGFPSVYRGDDVVTGDRITLYRTTGVVEVMATNAAGRPENTKGPARKTEFTKEDEELIP